MTFRLRDPALTAARRLPSRHPPAAPRRLELASDFESAVAEPTGAAPSYGVAPVGIVTLAHDRFLVSDYSALYVVERHGRGWALTQLERPEGVDRFVPAGLAYDATTNLLYVANYTGGDVLVLAWAARDRLILRRRIAGFGLVGPEDVAPWNGGVVVADFDGDAVIAFDANGYALWSVELRSAHGVSVDAGRVYATGLYDRILVEITATGRIARKTGGIGYGANRFLWPTAVTAFGDGRIVVNDAHTGLITVYDRGFRGIGAIGGNGPGVDLFNYPYALARRDGGVAVADTYGARLVLLDAQWAARAQIALAAPLPEGTSAAPLVGDPRRPYVYPQLAAEDVACVLPGVRAVGGYNALNVMGRRRRPAYELDVGQPGIGYLYATWAQATPVGGRADVVLLGTPQQPGAWLIDGRTGAWTHAMIGYDVWPSTEGPRRGGAVALDPKKWEFVAGRFAALERLLAGGADRAQAFRETIPGADRADFFDELLGGTPSGRDFIAARRAGVAVTVAAHRYFRAVRRLYYRRLFEELAVRYLAG